VRACAFPTHTPDVREPRAKAQPHDTKHSSVRLVRAQRAGRDCAAFKKTRCDDSIASTAKHDTGEGEKDD
jgi:hypothetical protein